MHIWDLIAMCTYDADISAVLLFLAIFFLIYLTKRKPVGIPPGSALTLPGVGDLPLLFGGDILKTFRKLRQRYGDIFSFYFGQNLMIVINGFDLIQKAAVKNGHIFSGRPKSLLGKVGSERKGIIFVEGPFWKRQRKFTLSCLQELGFGKTLLAEKILKEAECFVAAIRNQGGEPFDIKDVSQASVANVIFAIVCGKRHEYDDEQYRKLLQDTSDSAKKILKLSVLFSCLPVLRYIPGDPFNLDSLRKNIEKWEEFLIKMYVEHKESHDENNPRDYIDFFITEMSKQKNMSDETDFTVKQLNAVGRDLFLAGSDTTATVIRWALLYLLKYPDIQHRLHSDIDKVIPNGELPSLDDRIKLPYVEAFIMELLRCANVLPLAVAHSVTTEKGGYVFEGYSFPENTTVIFNLDSVLQDPVTFENPTQFNPERYLGSDGDIIRPKEFIPFGIGRRICLGEAVAKMELFLYLTTMLKRFDFLPENESEPDMEAVFGVTYLPKPFKVRAIERKSAG